VGVAVGCGQWAWQWRVNYFPIFFPFCPKPIFIWPYIASELETIQKHTQAHKQTTNGIEVNVKIFVAYLWLPLPLLQMETHFNLSKFPLHSRAAGKTA